MSLKRNIALFGFIIILVFIAGCVSEDSNKATSSPEDKVSSISEEQKQQAILATATHASVDTTTKNWDADAEDDGIVVNPSLKDSSDETVKFEGVSLPVDIKIYTTKIDDNFKEVNDRLVYSGSSTINSWKDGNFFFNGGIKILFEDIKTVASDKEYGRIIVTIHTPDGRSFEAKQDFGTRIKPEKT